MKAVKSLDEIIPQIQGWVNSLEGIKCVYIFGSYARGDNQCNSDLDLAVEIYNENEDFLVADQKVDELKRNKAAENLENIIGCKLQIDVGPVDTPIWTCIKGNKCQAQKISENLIVFPLCKAAWKKSPNGPIFKE